MLVYKYLIHIIHRVLVNMCFDFLIQGLLGNNFVSLKWKHMCIALTTLIPTPMVMKGPLAFFWCKKSRFFLTGIFFGWMDGWIHDLIF